MSDFEFPIRVTGDGYLNQFSDMVYENSQIGYLNGEIFLPIYNVDGYIITGNVYVSNYGRVYDANNNCFKNQITTDRYYKKVSLKCSTGKIRVFFTHRVVLNTFIPIKYTWSYEVNHRNGNKSDNSLYNLEWVLPSENRQHASDNNLNPKSNTGKDTVLRICELLAETDLSINEISEITGVIPRVINNIYYRKTYKDISIPFVFIPRSTAMFTEKEIHMICKFFQEVSVKEEDYPQLAALLDLEYDKQLRRRFNSIRFGENYTDISSLYIIPKAKIPIFSEEQIHQICSILEQHGTQIKPLDICTQIGVEYTRARGIAINELKRKRNYKKICNKYNY